MITRRDILAYSAATLAASTSASVAAVPAESLRDDAAILRHAITALHPGLYRYNTPQDMQTHFDAMSATLAQNCTLGQAHLACARLTAQIRCGHSFLNPENQTGAALDLIANGRTRLPVLFRWLGGRMIVLRSLSDQAALPPGTEILSIGGVPAEQFLQTLCALAPADGLGGARRVRLMEAHGDRWDLFDIYSNLAYPAIFANGAVRLQVQSQGGFIRSQTMPLQSLAEKRAAAAAFMPPEMPHGVLWHLETPPRGPALLRMKSWAVFNSTWDWRGHLNAMFDDLAARNVPGLIIDLRGNAGGLDVGGIILSRLASRALPKPAYRRKTRYRRVPTALDPYLHSWDNGFRDWGSQADGPDADGFYRLTESGQSHEDDVIRPQGRRFTGKVAVLIDAANSSASFMFAAAIKQHSLATLIGQATGGSRRGINGGAFFFLTLPQSGLEIDLPLIGYFPDTPQPDAGILPDIAVEVTQADIAAGTDPEMARAVALLRG